MKYFFTTLSLTGLLAFTACTDSEMTGNGTGGTNLEVPEGYHALELKVGGISTGATTKANVVATDDETRVNAMAIFVFKKTGSNDDDASYTYLDYWVMNPRNNGNDMFSGHLFNLGGSGQYRTATIYVPKDAGTVKLVAVTGGRGTNFKVYRSDGTTTGESNLIVGFNDFNEIPVYITPASHPFKDKTLAQVKQMLIAPKERPAAAAAGTTTEIDANYFFGYNESKVSSRQLSMGGITQPLTLSTDRNAEGVDMTIYRHVARIDVVNNSLTISKLDICNLTPLTPFVPDPNSKTATGATHLSTLYTNSATETFEGQTYNYTTEHNLFTKGTDDLKAASYYVYPNEIPAANGTDKPYAPYFRVTIEGTTYRIPFQTRNAKTGAMDAVDLIANHRYTLLINSVGDDYIDYNIIVSDWTAGDEINIDMGKDATAEQLAWTPAIASVEAAGQDAVWQFTHQKATLVFDQLLTSEEELGEKNNWKKIAFKSNRADDMNIWLLTEKGTFQAIDKERTVNAINLNSQKISTMLRMPVMWEYSRESDVQQCSMAPLTSLIDNIVWSGWLGLQNPYNTALISYGKFEEYDRASARNMLGTDLTAPMETLLRMAEVNLTDASTFASCDLIEGTIENGANSLPNTVSIANYESPAADDFKKILPSKTLDDMTSDFETGTVESATIERETLALTNYFAKTGDATSGSIIQWKLIARDATYSRYILLASKWEVAGSQMTVTFCLNKNIDKLPTSYADMNKAFNKKSNCITRRLPVGTYMTSGDPVSVGLNGIAPSDNPTSGYVRPFMTKDALNLK